VRKHDLEGQTRFTVENAQFEQLLHITYCVLTQKVDVAGPEAGRCVSMYVARGPGAR
jgi:hypothetical protein